MWGDRLARHWRLDVAVRVVVDAVMVSLSVLVGILAALWLVPLGVGAPGVAASPASAPLADVAGLFLRSVPLVTLVTLGLFVATGVYIRARFYRAGYKIPVLAQSITLAYLLVAVASRMLGPLLPIPWSVLVVAWLATLVLVIGSRFISGVRRLVPGSEPSLEVAPAAIRTVLVLGGAGYIGSTLCRQLLARNYRVQVLDALLYGDDSVRDLVGGPNFELIEGDSRDISNLVRAVRGADAVVHLGEIVGDPACALDEQITLEINLAATRLAAEVTKGFGVQRFVYASSCSVYGVAEGIVDERSGLNPVSLYARTKIGAERLLLGLRDQSFHPVIVRLATVYGMSYRPRFDLVVNTLAARAFVDGEITIFGGGQWRPFVHVADVAAALILCLERPLDVVDGQVFNVGSDAQNYTIRELGGLVQTRLPQTRMRIVGSVDDERDYRVSFSKIRDQLQFRPRMTVSDGIREVVAALAAGEITTYSDPRYHNAAFLGTPPGSQKIRAFHPSLVYEANRSTLDQLLLSVSTQVGDGPHEAGAVSARIGA